MASSLSDRTAARLSRPRPWAQSQPTSAARPLPEACRQRQPQPSVSTAPALGVVERLEARRQRIAARSAALRAPRQDLERPRAAVHPKGILRKNGYRRGGILRKEFHPTGKIVSWASSTEEVTFERWIIRAVHQHPERRR
ncbi:MAG: hypothetical protein M1830_001222 [Pleopsidium flavum]|nr:MAG: hypothetical protein M1830_001222 [Pleopsidium flavum]